MQKTLNLCALMLFLCLFMDKLVAQAAFNTVEEVNLNNSQKEKLKLATKEDWVETYKVIDINDAEKTQKDGMLDFDFPGHSKTVKVKKKEIEFTKNKDYIWKGKIEGDGNIVEMGYQNGAKFGYAIVDDKYYTIEDIGDGKSVVIKHDTKKYKNTNCIVNKGKATKIIEDQEIEVRTGPNTANCAVKVLVVHTQAAQNAVSNINGIASTGVMQTNTAFANSGINGRLIPVDGSTRINFVESTGIINDINNLNTSQQIRDLRIANGADIVVVLVNASYTVGGLPVVGTVDTDFSTNTFFFRDPNHPVVLVHVNHATSQRFTFAHEVGHLFNARHRDDGDAPPGGGHFFKTGTVTRNTVMEQAAPGAARIQYFSNPDIRFQNVATGIANERDNSFNINSSFCNLAFWRNSAEVILSGYSQARANEPAVTVKANAIADLYPVTVQWSTSQFNGNYQTVKTESLLLGTNYSQYSFTFPNMSPYSTFYVKCRMTTANGIVVESIKTIQCIPNAYAASNYSLNTEKIEIAPNPTYNLVRLKRYDKPIGTIHIFNSMGQLMETRVSDILQDEINLSNFPKGMYFIKIIDTQQVEKVILQ